MLLSDHLLSCIAFKREWECVRYLYENVSKIFLSLTLFDMYKLLLLTNAEKYRRQKALQTPNAISRKNQNIINN